MRFQTFAAAILISAAGCRCQPETPKQQFGEIGITYDLQGVTVTRDSGAYHFRGIAMGTMRTIALTVKNLGSGALDLQSFTRTDGDDVFTVDFQPSTLGGGEAKSFSITFPAPVTDADHDYTSTWLLTAGNTGMSPTTATVTIDGTAIKAECVLPDSIDFGGVAVGATATRTLHFENRTSLDSAASLGAITSSNGDDAAFGYGPGFMAGALPLPSGQKYDVTFTFGPTQTQSYLALVKLKAASHCSEQTVKLVGSGVTAALDCASLDFGFLPPGLTTTQSTTVTNYSLEDASLTALHASSADFAPKVTTLTVPAAQRVMQNGSLVLMPGTARFDVDFKPTHIGVLNGSVTATSSLAAMPSLSCAVTGTGGGPNIELKPSGVLDFGAVPYFAVAPAPFFVTRKMTIQNLGSAPTPPDVRANLKLGMAGVPPPYWQVRPKNADSHLSDICVGFYDASNPNPSLRCTNAPSNAYDPQLGLPATGAQGLLDVPIRISPSEANKTLEFDVDVYSNDPDEPVTTLTVRAHSVVLPPCSFTVTPTNLQFGLVVPPESRDLAFNIKNLGQNAGETCLLTHLELAPGADLTFTLPNGELDQRTLNPGETVAVTVRATGAGLATTTLRQVMGAVRFGISSPTFPSTDVALSAAIGLACLTISPSELDFGTVRQGCDSDRHVFSIYNTCSLAVVVNGYSMLAAAGQPIGGPNCMNQPQPCHEFLVDGTPGLPADGGTIPPAASMPTTFALKYHPIDLGSDMGAFALDITQSGQRVQQLVTLKGTGDMAGLNTDSFAQDPRPKADILWVIDNSCSMYNKQTLLSMNFASVISYAMNVVPGGIDYQMGVIDSDPNPMTQGKLHFDTSNPKILRPSLPNVDALFRSKVRVGTSGSGTEHFSDGAVRALTAPLINTDNAGFLRPDAILAVIAVTDAGDQSLLPAAVLEGQLRNVKGAQRPGLFSYNVIGPFSPSFPPGCDPDDYVDTTLHDYLVATFNGKKGQICALDWTQTLQDIGQTAFGYRTRFYLNAQPDLTVLPSPFTVKLDGIVMPQTDMSGGTVWTYDAMSNSMNFAAQYVPEPGQTLTVTYQTLCN